VRLKKHGKVPCCNTPFVSFITLVTIFSWQMGFSPPPRVNWRSESSCWANSNIEPAPIECGGRRRHAQSTISIAPQTQELRKQGATNDDESLSLLRLRTNSECLQCIWKLRGTKGVENTYFKRTRAKPASMKRILYEIIKRRAQSSSFRVATFLQRIW